MDSTVIVDLSDDDSHVEKKAKVNQRKFKELKKYIPFLKYITEKDPARNYKYAKLYEKFKTKTLFQERVANMCENTIILRYQKLRSSMVFPRHIANIFTEIDTVVISDEDEDAPVSSNGNISKVLIDSSPESNLKSDKSENKNSSAVERGKNVRRKVESKHCVVSKEKKCLTSSLPSSKAVNIQSIEILKTSTSTEKTISGAICDQSKASTSIKTPSEDGEILSDDEETIFLKNKSQSSLHSISSFEFSPPGSPKNRTKIIDTEDDDSKQELFRRIDQLSKGTVDVRDSGVLSWKDLEKEQVNEIQKSPILKQKNLDEGLFRRRSPKSLLPELRMSSDEDTSNSIPHRKKKKKHKRRKKGYSQTHDWYISEVENQAEKGQALKQTLHRRDTASSDDNFKIKDPIKQRKGSKKHKEKKQQCRLLYVSDDEEEVDAVNTDDFKPTETKLFNRRDPTKKDNKAQNSNNNVTVVLLDSDEGEVNSVPAIIPKSGKTFMISPSPTSYPPLPPKASTPICTSVPSTLRDTSVPVSSSSLDASSSNVMEVSKQKKDISSSAIELRDINNMDLDELSDIYSKLCESTGIELEKLLAGLVTKSAEDIGEDPPTTKEQFCNQPDLDTNTSSENYNGNNDFVSNEDALGAVLHPQHLEHQQMLIQQEEREQQQQLHQQSLQLQCHPNQMRSDLPVPYPYQNTLRPGLNLKDPRIVQKLKQIKDSPIHNMSIRESADFLMNFYTSRPQISSNPIPEVTSKTATTYGEHKRLLELEKQKEIERKNTKKLMTVTSNKKETEHVSRVYADNIQCDDSSRSVTTKEVVKLTKGKPKRMSSSGSESCKKSKPKCIEIEKEPDEEKAIMSFSLNRRARRPIMSSSSSDDDNVSLQKHSTSKENVSSGLMTPFEVEQVLDIVLPVIGKTKEIESGTSGNLSTPSKSKSRRNSSRKSIDSTKSDSNLSKSKRKSETAQKNTEKATINNGLSKGCQELDGLNKLSKTNYDEASTTSTGKRKKKGRPPNTGGPDKGRVQRLPKVNKSPLKRGCRELNNLNCTIIDYQEMFEKNSIPTVDGRRSCSALTASIIENHLDSSDNTNQKSENNFFLRSKRCKSNDGDAHTSRKNLTAAPICLRRQTCSALQRQPLPEKIEMPPIKILFRRLSGSGTFGVEGVADSSCNDIGIAEVDPKEHRSDNINQDLFESLPIVKLKKLSPEEIRKSIKLSNDKTKKNKFDSKASKSNKKVCATSQEMPILIAASSTPVNSPLRPIPKLPKHLNVDINMTPTSSKVCAICNKRPFDLTNHYVVQHKTESYISRLTSTEIENLEASVTLAVPFRKRYKVECAFCQDELEDIFVNFYNHYSYHTGEYGFKCDVCEIVKPYREDIRSHQLRTSRCRNSKIRTNYLYSSDLTVIYLYVCKLCNFVQLNEANVHKHQRDHHGFTTEVPQQVKKCIIAALDSGEVINECLLNVADEENFKEENIPGGAVLMTRGQEFVHESPLDIKDILMTQENQSSHDHEIKCSPQNPSVLTSVNQQIEPQVIKQEMASNCVSFENLVEDINMDIEQADSKTSTSPETLLEQLHAPQTTNIMTVVHCAEQTPYQERHQPYIEPMDQKPNINAIKIEPLDPKPQQSKARMSYRKLYSDSKYFGLYKCMHKGCWFSTNVGDRFIQHTTFHTDKKENIYINCAYCTVKNSCAQKLVRHVRSRHSMSLYQCSECCYRSMIPGNVSIHQRVYHKDSTAVKCTYECAGRIRTIQNKFDAMKKKMIANVSSLKCPDCPSMFFALSSIESHIKKVHPLSLNTLDSAIFREFACIYCKKESNSRQSMQIHLAIEHPDEMGYVVERKLKSDAYGDAIENLDMTNISVPTTDVRQAPFTESICEPTEPITEDVDIDVKPPSEESSITETKNTAESSTITKDEQLIYDRIEPLLVLLTENTGFDDSTLYRCTACIASFFNFELWLTHIKNRHNIIESVACPYCAKSITLDLAASHFESHSRHRFMCFHCITSFCSRTKVLEHFSSCHKDNQPLEKTILCSKKLYCIVKKQDTTVLDWVLVLQNFAGAIRSSWIERLQKSTNFEWWEGLTSACLEEIEIPQYITNGQPRYKCLLRSCPFVGLDENELDHHVSNHTVPRNYKCSHCALDLASPSWENIKNHKMLHKNNFYICCVCKFFHHNYLGITNHIENLHNSRDVPVINLWRDETNYKISLAILLPYGKIDFTTTVACFSCGKEMKNSSKFRHHLRTEHNIVLRLKCGVCDETLLTQADAETHTKYHEMQTFKLKFDVLTTKLYNLTVKSISPLTIEIMPEKEKRSNQLVDIDESISKRIKLESPIKVKEEVFIKTECEGDANPEYADSFERPSGSIKCVSIEQLVVKDHVITSCTQQLPEQGSIYVKPIAELQLESLTLIVPRGSQYQEHREGSHVSEIPTTFLSNQHNGQIMQSYPIGQIIPTSVTQCSPHTTQPLQAPSAQTTLKIVLSNNQGTAYPVTTTVVPPILQTQILSDINPSVAHYPQQNAQQTVSEMQPGINHPQAYYAQQNAQLSQNLVLSQDTCDPIIPEIAPVCENCKMECIDFSQLKSHFETVHAPKNERFLFRLVRKVKCAYCSFSGSLCSFRAHQATFHPNKFPLHCSILDYKRCGVCNAFFSNSLIPMCSCPAIRRVLADCINLKILDLLRNFGKKFNSFLCILCKKYFHNQHDCLQHILNVHNRTDIVPTTWLIDTYLYACSLCEKKSTKIEEIIEHMRNIHFSGTTMATLADRMAHYNKIGVVYPRGLILFIRDLKNTGSFNEKTFKEKIQCIEEKYSGSEIK